MLQAVAQIGAMRNGDLFRMASPIARKSIDAVKEIVSNFHSGIFPDVQTLQTSDFYKDVVERLKYFVSFEVTDDDSLPSSTTLVGQEALQAKWNKAVDDFKDRPSDMTLDDLETFQGFKYLLSKTQIAELTTMVKKVLHVQASTDKESSVATSSICSGGTGSASASSSNALKKFKEEKHTTRANLYKFFSTR